MGPLEPRELQPVDDNAHGAAGDARHQIPKQGAREGGRELDWRRAAEGAARLAGGARSAEAPASRNLAAVGSSELSDRGGAAVAVVAPAAALVCRRPPSRGGARAVKRLTTTTMTGMTMPKMTREDEDAEDAESKVLFRSALFAFDDGATAGE